MIELPGYTIEKQLGRGGMARVYLARHIGLDRLVAIKVLSKDLDGDKSFSDRFMREARIVARLSHQNIITVYDVGVHNEFHYIAMEYLPGETLDDKIKKKLDIRQILDITRQIAAALDFAHKKGIVHRDVKPDNILFREDGSAVLTDFGIARAAKSETRMTATGTVIGTPHYMSPEQAQSQEIGPWSDLYSLGIVLYEMLSGEVPFDADSTIAVVFKHITEPVPELDEPYKKYQPLVNTLLAKVPDARYQSGREIIADIEALNRGECAANATHIFNQTVINPSVSSATTQTAQTGKDASRQADKPSSLTSRFTAAAAIISITAITSAIVFFSMGKTPNHADDTAASQDALNLAYETQQLEERQRELDKRAAESTLLEQQRIAAERLQREKSKKEALQREQARLIAQQKQQQAEAEARKAKQELQALKQSQLKQKQLEQKRLQEEQLARQKEQAVKTRTASTSSITQQKAVAEPAQETKVKPVKTGILAGWLGATDNDSEEFISDLFEAADNALSTANYASARQNYQGVLQIEPNNQRAQQGLISLERMVSEDLARSDDAYTSDLLKAADNALQTDRLSSASYNYQEVLRLAPENKYAQHGLNEVFNRYLALAVEEARDEDFDDAAEYFLAAKKLRPDDEKLNTVGREIAQLQSK